MTTNMNNTKTGAVVIVRDSNDRRYPWRQYLVIRDEHVSIVEMTRAMQGWNFGRVIVQGASDWPNMSAANIVAWKLAHDDRATLVTDTKLAELVIARLAA